MNYNLFILFLFSNLSAVTSLLSSHRYFCDHVSYDSSRQATYFQSVNNKRTLSVIPSTNHVIQHGTIASVRWETNTAEFLTISLVGADGATTNLTRMHSLMKSFNWKVPYTIPAKNRYRIIIASETDSTLRDTTDYFTVVEHIQVYSKPLLLPNSSDQSRTAPMRQSIFDSLDISKSSYPSHEIILKVDSGHSVYGLAYLPTKITADQINYEIYVSIDGEKWGDRIASGTMRGDAGEQRITFDTTTANYMRLVALSEVSGQNFASTAELTLLFARITDEVGNRQSFKTKIQTLSVQILSDVISVELSEGKPSQLTLFAANGAQLFSAPIPAGKNHFSVKSLGLAKGVYFLKLDGIEGIQTQRIMLR